MRGRIGAQQLQLEIELAKPAAPSAPPVGQSEQLVSANGEAPSQRSPPDPLPCPHNRAVHAPSAEELVHNPDALLTRTHLRLLGLERRAIDAVFRALPVVALPGYARPMILARDYLDLVDQNTYRDDRVRPIARAHG